MFSFCLLSMYVLINTPFDYTFWSWIFSTLIDKVGEETPGLLDAGLRCYFYFL